jgi:L-amino acid N-acyltransferase YncA
MIIITVIRRDESKPDEYEVVANVRSKQIGSIKIEIQSNRLFAGIQAKTGIIDTITIDKDFRMQGITQQMLKAAMAKFAKEKVDIAMTEATTDKLAKMYSRVGFVKRDQSNIMIASVGNKKIFDLIRQNINDIMIDPRALRKSLYHPE